MGIPPISNCFVSISCHREKTDFAFSKKFLAKVERDKKALKPNFLDFKGSLITLRLHLEISQRRILIAVAFTREAFERELKQASLHA